MKHKSIQYKKLTAFRSTLKMWFSIGRVKEWFFLFCFGACRPSVSQYLHIKANMS
jgi:hypothetical protein